MKIAILDDYQNTVKDLDSYALLEGHDVTVCNDTPTDPAILHERLADTEALILIRERTIITDDLLSHLPQLKLISQTGKISNHLDLATCTKHGVAVAEGRGSPVAPSELCWALIMAATRHIVPYATNLTNNQWQDSGNAGLGRTLKGLTLGIWGYGKIGQRIARYGEAFGMNILVWGSETSRQKAIDNGCSAASTKTEFFQTADIISLHLRLNEATRACVTAEDLQQMKTDALIVNTSRAELIEANALAEALQAGRPGFAAIDVYEQEPANTDNSQLLAMDNVLCSPHIGYVEQNSYELYFQIAFENVVAFAEGEAVNIANPEVL
uniref:D-3-phosphoglycerate dehydrogenase (EC) n=1 Tax=uncultured Thiotrichaceae bacterium TaxID=298394 RepID=A0A6S6UFD8_9GAMM|nr:MAG: D-3-phosphoglycerate dehydrogenase (EC [uncultured Thiotrichaceae bacterium]